MKVSLNWLKDYVRIKQPATKVSELLTAAGLNVERVETVGGDTVFELEITTNRPDWLSHIGVARELHAVTGASFMYKKGDVTCPHSVDSKTEKTFKVLTPDPDLCPYYSAALLEEVEWNETPDFMKKRLEACGIRSINLIVDITNYVLLEYGQPLHAFDADVLKGGQILARRAKPGEKMTAIDGTVYELAKDDLMIADSSGPIAIGGVMGGKNSEVSERTKNILLESAFFNPVSVRRTSRRLGLSSESSYRFERRVDPRGVDQARERAVYLILKYAHAKRVSSVFRSGKLPIKEAKIVLNVSDVKRILGVQISESKTKSYLTRLGLKVSGTGKAIRVQAPSFRVDLVQPIDLIEEIARIYGYEKIPETLPMVFPIEPRVDPILVLENDVRNLCVGLGFSEAITFSLVESSLYDRLGLFKEGRVTLINPKNKELNLMRPSLLSCLAQSVRRNLFAGQTDIRLFEVGNRYLSTTGLPKEERMVALILSGEGRLGWLEKKRPLSFYDLKGGVSELLSRLGIQASEAYEHDSIYQTGEGITLSAKGEVIGSCGTLSDRVRKLFDLDKPVFYAELSLEKILSLIQKGGKVKDIPKFPASPRDLTLIMDERVKAESVTREIRKLAGELTDNIEVFDYFKGGQIPKGKKSLSFRIYYQAKDRTLQNEEVNKLHFSIIDELNHSFGAELPKGKD